MGSEKRVGMTVRIVILYTHRCVSWLLNKTVSPDPFSVLGLELFGDPLSLSKLRNHLCRAPSLFAGYNCLVSVDGKETGRRIP